MENKFNKTGSNFGKTQNESKLKKNKTKIKWSHLELLISFSSNSLKGGKIYKNKMDESTQQKMNMYIGKLNEIKALVQNEQTAAILLLLTEINQNRYRGQSEKVVINENAPATESQKAYLFSLGATVPNNLTRQQASILIKTAKAEQQGMKNALRMPIRIP